jgi:FAD synthase
VLTVGNFDGVHVGHQEILRIVTERARGRGGESAVYTFEPHPRKVLRPAAAPKLLTTLEQKLERIEAAGVDVAIVALRADFARRRRGLRARVLPPSAGGDLRATTSAGHDREARCGR